MSTQSQLRLRDHTVFHVMGRLAPTTTLAAAQAELDAQFQLASGQHVDHRAAHDVPDDGRHDRSGKARCMG